MFVCITRYLRGIDGEEAHLDAHWRYLDERLAAGELVCSGPQVPRIGGLLVLNVPDREEAARFMRADPLVGAGLVSYELIEFEATRTAPGLEPRRHGSGRPDRARSAGEGVEQSPRRS